MDLHLSDPLGVFNYYLPHSLTPNPTVCMHPKQKPAVAVVEDDRSLATLLADHLNHNGFAAQVFHKASSFLRHAEKEHVGLVLLDLSLPDLDGIEVLGHLRRLNSPPAVVVLSATDATQTICQALDNGADDYVCKPFERDVLLARLRAVLRRTETSRDRRLTHNADLGTTVFNFGGAKVHPERLEIEFGNGSRGKIGRKELGILYHLQANPSVIVSRHTLIHSVWGEHANIRSRSLDQYVVKIRDLFGKNNESLTCFRTIHGIGYWYEPVG